MRAIDLSNFRLRQAAADLRHQTRSLPSAGIRRIGAGLGLRGSGGGDLQLRLEWYFSGKAPLTDLRRDRVAHGAMLMASALPEDDFEPFIAATVMLLLDRLSSADAVDDGFWIWRRLAPHYRLAPAPTRAAIMNGFREGGRRGLIAVRGGPSAADCVTLPRDAVLAELAQSGGHPVVSAISEAVRLDVDAARAGALWADLHREVANLPDALRRVATLGLRHLYERPASMEPPLGSSAGVIPVHD